MEDARFADDCDSDEYEAEFVRLSPVDISILREAAEFYRDDCRSHSSANSLESSPTTSRVIQLDTAIRHLDDI
jgi:hypothetical protein